MCRKRPNDLEERKCTVMGGKMNGKELITLQFADDQVIIKEI